ncbi:alpha/beta fold hydrolase [Caldimonas tepidiphila]|uniref:alpha/beta fold hydrolase n=1 Tax=Caldimonas tepidiphila TaxID=2315841 RepID=UPI0013007908|nr:alpha/beta hydrolase [Caldimonas tepidiphila]
MSAALRADAPLGFVLHPGWGFAADALAPWAGALARRWPEAPVLAWERPYFGAAARPRPADEVRWIGIGHSFGHALLRQAELPWQGLVALHGFSRFCRRPQQPQGTPPRLLDAMRARLQAEPQGVLADFHRLCGSERQPPGLPDVAALDEDLLALRELDLAPATVPLLALASRDDAVVPAALSEACFAGRAELRWRDGDHCAWLRAADEGVAQLADWLAGLPSRDSACGAPR